MREETQPNYYANWDEHAEHLYETTLLGKREAQIALLTAKGHTIEEIHQLLKETEDNPPQPRTIESHKSKLKRKLGNTTITHSLLNKNITHTTPPVYAPNEHPTTNQPNTPLKNTTHHAYIGQIGSGTTITSQRHALQIDTDEHTDHIVVYDYYQAWLPIAKYFTNIHTITPPPQTTSIDPQNIINTIKQKPNTDTITLFIDLHLPIILNKDPSFLDKLDALDHTISIRYILQNWPPNHEQHNEPDMIHTHRTDCTHYQSYLTQLYDTSPLTFQTHNPEHVKTLPINPPHITTINTTTGETTTRPNHLSPTEKEILIETNQA